MQSQRGERTSAGIPNYGGRSPEGNPITQKSWGRMKIPTPRQMVRMLDQYVVGQGLAKKVLSVGVHNHYKRVEHDQMRQQEEERQGNDTDSDVAKLMKYPELKMSRLPADEAERYMRLNLLARTDPAAVRKMIDILFLRI